MKNLLFVAALLLLISGYCLAGSGYDNCTTEEKALKTEEVSDCSGISYLLNPSACFAKRKLLKEYAAGKCRNIGLAENVIFTVPAGVPEKKVRNTSSTGSTGAVMKKVDSEIVLQESTVERLKEENVRLKSEIIRLNAENEQLKRAAH